MDVSTPPSLDLACPQAKAEINKHAHMFRERGVDKTRYRDDFQSLTGRYKDVTTTVTHADGTTTTTKDTIKEIGRAHV